MEAVVLCGGMASRLGSIAQDVPKALLPVHGRPFLEWQLTALERQCVRRVVLATGHLGDRIREQLGDGSRLGLDLAYSQEAEPLGTAGAIRLAAQHVREWPLLALNGDSFCLFDVNLMLSAHRRANAEATIWLAPERLDRRYGSVELDSGGRVTAFREKPSETSSERSSWISAGIYLLESKVLNGLEAGRMASLETDVFPNLAGGRLSAVKGSAAVIDIGTPESLAAADRALAVQFRRLQRGRPRSLEKESIAGHLGQIAALQAQVAELCGDSIASAAGLISNAFDQGGKLLLCGNGGSAADCQHMAAEFTNRLSAKVERAALPAIALTTDTSFLTAFANDYGFERVFARQIEAFGRPGDVLLGISSSGRSANVLAAFATASEKGLTTISISGTGGQMERVADCAIVIPSADTQAVQEAMLPVEHLVCELVEQSLIANDLSG